MSAPFADNQKHSGSYRRLRDNQPASNALKELPAFPLVLVRKVRIVEATFGIERSLIQGSILSDIWKLARCSMGASKCANLD